MPRRVLFVIRGKLGDTLVAYATVRRYVDAFPDDAVTLLTRSQYADLLVGEKGLRVLGFSNKLGMLLTLLRLSFEPQFDALLVLWGFGTPIVWIGRLVSARRKVYVDGRYSATFPEFADLLPNRLQSEPMWRVAQIFEPALSPPEKLLVPSLAKKRVPHPRVIGVAPLADELRRIMSPKTLAALMGGVARKYPGAPIRVFVNQSDRGADALISAGLPTGAEFRFFPKLQDLVSEFAELAHIYCTDTGLYHLAASMGIPTTVFYGPTQPWKNMLAGQPVACSARLTVLGVEHCEEKACAAPLCLDAAVGAFAGTPPVLTLSDTPPGCPLRLHPSGRLSEIRWHENPRHQA